MKCAYVAIAAMLLVAPVAVVTAQERLIPPGCPAVSVQRPAAQTNGPVTTERTASNKLAAEGQAATRSFSGDAVAKAISLYEQAVRADPTNAAANVSLARAHTQSQRYMSVPKKLAQARAWESLSKGRALDPSNIDGLLPIR